MVRVYKRQPGSRNYKTGYTKLQLQNAIREVKSGSSSVLQASKTFKIPYGTLHTKTRPGYVQPLNPGRPRVLSSQEEVSIVYVINHLTDWKVPLSEFDIRLLVQNYLNRQGRVTLFKQNLPGYDWVKGFAERHHLTKRMAGNVKPSRAEIGHDILNEYFDNLEEVLADVDPANMYNYDETNVIDDPGSKKCIVRRGLRRIERKMPHSKQAVSVMFCGNARGQYLPPMIVYKAGNLYQGWTQNGPDGALYASSTSGWFDNNLFEQWFFGIFLERVKNTPGKKVLIGDNLASHFSEKVLISCEENDIAFVSLVPNATHLLQPLDVSAFGPAKKSWRKIISDWRKEVRTKQGIPKTVWPVLIRHLCSEMNEKRQNLISGFVACGIVPMDRNQVLKRLPPRTEQQPVQNVLGETVAELLRENLTPPANKTRQKRGNKVPAGKAVKAADLNNNASSGAGPRDKGKKQKRGRKRKAPSSDEEDEEDEEEEETELVRSDQNNNVPSSSGVRPIGKKAREQRTRKKRTATNPEDELLEEEDEEIDVNARSTSCSSSANSRYRPTQRVVHDTVNAEDSGSEEEKEAEDDVCGICMRWNPPSKTPKINWECCESCDEWYHLECLKRNGAANADSYCCGQ